VGEIATKTEGTRLERTYSGGHGEITGLAPGLEWEVAKRKKKEGQHTHGKKERNDLNASLRNVSRQVNPTEKVWNEKRKAPEEGEAGIHKGCVREVQMEETRT